MRQVPILTQTEVLVVGGGPSGFAAALASARMGVKTLLVERYGFLGGMATAAEVNPFMISKVSGRPIIGGIFQELVGELKKKKACEDGEVFGQPHIVFDPEILKSILFELATKADLKLLLHSCVSGAVIKGEEIKGVIVQNKSGEGRILAKAVIDASGDADIAYMSGVTCFKGREEDRLMQPATLYFTLGGVNEEKMPSREDIDKMYRKAKAEGRIKNPREKVLWFKGVRAGELHFNSTRVTKIDGTKAADLTKAEIEARRQVMELVSFLKKEIPGFESSYLLSTGVQIGVRETRRIKGEYILTEEDVTQGKKFKDVIAMASYPIDVHSPTGEGTIFKPLGTGNHYDIPYRCLLPQEISGLIVVGRAISVTHEALSSTRVMPTCMAIGEAGGTAAALSVIDKVMPKNVNVENLQKQLREQGAIIDVR
ncbi:hypothetical protein AMJ44_03935 [candidate division WOR-1 bacterium DG_54_3]|uniref:FAD-dependent oxidoreductase n=1 Tax=candidate division WOR-1 bacterium DG_54_3 TaxID=1703775 RepID=A0A0S7Y453_UNCSA|nr:MAG: hypothetical protein AMJ44_03935 [candidate division WOR-1 bacterium DG_54_3]